jgi:hypothetical protein
VPRKPAPSFALKLVGVSFQKDYPENAFDLAKLLKRHERRGLDRPLLTLIRNPKNKHDANAIEVHDDYGKLGHIPAAIAARLAPELDDGIRWECELIKIPISSEQPDQPGIEVRCRRVKEPT